MAYQEKLALEKVEVMSGADEGMSDRLARIHPKRNTLERDGVENSDDARDELEQLTGLLARMRSGSLRWRGAERGGLGPSSQQAKHRSWIYD